MSVDISLYWQRVPFRMLFKKSAVMSVLSYVEGCGPPFDQSTQVNVRLEFFSQNFMVTKVVVDCGEVEQRDAGLGEENEAFVGEIQQGVGE
nr:hypothetical protein TorRG33x02_171930 [Ipomoea batatas]